MNERFLNEKRFEEFLNNERLNQLPFEKMYFIVIKNNKIKIINLLCDMRKTNHQLYCRCIESAKSIGCELVDPIGNDFNLNTDLLHYKNIINKIDPNVDFEIINGVLHLFE